MAAEYSNVSISRTSIISVAAKRSMRSCRLPQRHWHKTQNHYQQRGDRQHDARCVERSLVVNRRDAEKSQSQQNSRPRPPDFRSEVSAENGKACRNQPAHPPMQTRIQRSQNMSAVQLARRKQVERGSKNSHPRSAANRMQ